MALEKRRHRAPVPGRRACGARSVPGRDAGAIVERACCRGMVLWVCFVFGTAERERDGVLDPQQRRARSSGGESAALIRPRSLVRVQARPQVGGAHETRKGAVAQPGERRPCTAEVRGSNPRGSTALVWRTLTREEVTPQALRAWGSSQTSPRAPRRRHMT